MANQKLNYIDLFAGCGGLSLGLHNAGWKGVFAIEKNKDAFSTLEYNLIKNVNHFNWPKWLPQQNLEIDYVVNNFENELKSLRGKVDMVAGGPPCQGFSMAGRRNENDKRNQLVKSYIKFISLVKPKILFFENVKGFTQAFNKNKEKGIAYSSYVESELDQAGYYVKGALVNFGEYGIPQKRTRFILVGVRKDIPNSSKELAVSFFTKISDNKYDFLSKNKITVETNLQDAISDLLQSNGLRPCPDKANYKSGIYNETPQSNYQILMRKGIVSNEKIPDSHRFAKHREDIKQKFSVILDCCRRNKGIDDDIRKKYNIKKHTIIPLSAKEKSPTITTLPDDYIHYLEPRILTVREYARIQSFPDWYKFQGKYTTGGILRSKEVPRYSQIGNAIPPLFGEQSGLVLKKMIK